MRYAAKPLSVVGILAVLGVLACLLTACDSAGLYTPDSSYGLSGVAVADVNRDSSGVFLRTTQEDEVLDTANITFGVDVLVYDTILNPPQALYVKWHNTAAAYAGQNRTLSFVNGTFSRTVVSSIPATFTVDVAVPATRISNGAQTVSIEWTPDKSTVW